MFKKYFGIPAGFFNMMFFQIAGSRLNKFSRVTV